jgi:hypothetical protein
MNVTKRIVFMIAIGVLGTFVAGASIITTTTWAPDTTPDGFGTGVLRGVTVTYTAVVDATRQSGETITVPWNTALGTAPVCITPSCSDNSAGVIGTESATQAVDIHFSTPVINPVLLMAYTDPGSSMIFGQSLTLLSSNNAQLSGNTVAFVGAGNAVNDGFAAQFTGSISDITFTYVFQGTGLGAGGSNYTSAAFTVGDVPEPASLGLGIAGLVGLLIYRRRAVAR